MKNLIARFFRETEGQDLIEYALLSGIIATGIITAVGTIQGYVSGKFGALSNALVAGS
jgi:Flp pilus assembly pilin Flp